MKKTTMQDVMETFYHNLKAILADEKDNKIEFGEDDNYPFAMIYDYENCYREEHICEIYLKDNRVYIGTTERDDYRLKDDKDLYFNATMISIATTLNLTI